MLNGASLCGCWSLNACMIMKTEAPAALQRVAVLNNVKSQRALCSVRTQVACKSTPVQCHKRCEDQAQSRLPHAQRRLQTLLQLLTLSSRAQRLGSRLDRPAQPLGTHDAPLIICKCRREFMPKELDS